MLLLRNRKRQLKFLGFKMRKDHLENLTLCGNTERKRDRGMDENLPDKPVQMFDKTWCWSDAEKKKLTMFYKR